MNNKKILKKMNEGNGLGRHILEVFIFLLLLAVGVAVALVLFVLM